VNTPSRSRWFAAREYDLAATLASGQAFRWYARGEAWFGVVHGRWVELRATPDGISAATSEPQLEWSWLETYLQTSVQLEAILATFPEDSAMRASVEACRGLRLLRQDPWECLASFILSSTKQIVQIRQIIALLCERFGESIAVPPGHPPAYGFPSAALLARATEAELRACKMGFRAPNLLAVARAAELGHINLAALAQLDLAEARARLIELPGVGPKIADCVLLFAYGFPAAFPVDVWVKKALHELYFPKRQPRPERMRHFVATHFGPNAGYAQQYLFHYMRTRH
jgi:N-glycosylase/DNA lyase